MNEKTIEVLIATMNRKNLEFLETMNLSTNAVVVNQNKYFENSKIHGLSGNKVKLINTLDKGLSKSRNLAIQHSIADICLLADDDMIYYSDYKEKVQRAYQEYPSADIIAFQVKRIGNPERTKKFRESMSWENYITSMKISSVEITFKRQSIIENNISFNPNIGAGTDFYNGEENIFIYDAMKKGLKVLYLPITIAQVDTTDSSWFEGYTKRYFHTVGAKYYNMTKRYYHLLIFQFALRKHKLYKNNISIYSAIKTMYEGVELYRKKYPSTKKKKSE